jgi:hypothetical protein
MGPYFDDVILGSLKPASVVKLANTSGLKLDASACGFDSHRGYKKIVEKKEK